MVNLIRVVDVSEYTTTIPHSWWTQLRDEYGVKAAVIQAWGGGYVPGRRNEHYGQHVEGALKADMGVATYVWPPHEYERAFQWIEWCGYKEELALYAHDVEQGAGVTQLYLEDADQWLGRESWIYASPSSWNRIMGGGQQYASRSLWLARYPRSPERHGGNTVWWPPRYNPFASYRVGGWQEARGWQFQGTTRISGESCDLNLFHADAFDRLPKEEEEKDMKPYLAWDIDRKRVYLVGPWGATWITNSEDVTKFETRYGALDVTLHASTLDALGRARSALPHEHSGTVTVQ